MAESAEILEDVKLTGSADEIFVGLGCQPLPSSYEPDDDDLEWWDQEAPDSDKLFEQANLKLKWSDAGTWVFGELRSLRDKLEQEEAAVRRKIENNEFTEDDMTFLAGFLFDELPVPSGDVLRFTSGSHCVEGDSFQNMHVSYNVIVHTTLDLYKNASPLTRRGERVWLLQVRYKEIRALHEELTAAGAELPDIPEKVGLTKISEKFSQETIESRRKVFIEIFDAIAADPKWRECESVVRFFWPREMLDVYRPMLEKELLSLNDGATAKEIASQNAKAMAKRKVAKTGLKFVGGAIPMVGGIVDGAFEFKDTRQINRAAAVGVGSGVCGFVGTSIGSTVGSMCVPVVGSVIGGFVVGSIASAAGAFGGRKLVKKKEPVKEIPKTPFD